MGKPYATEVNALPETFHFAATARIEALERGIRTASGGPLVAVGSGGSLTAAHFASALHQSTCGRVAKAMTPLEACTYPLAGPDISFLLLSAGGGNPDILDVFKNLVVEEPRCMVVLTAQTGTKLARLVKRYRYVDSAELALPSGRDGFLATNSLLAFCVVLTRAYANLRPTKTKVPTNFSRLLGSPRKIEAWREACQPLWERDNLVVLYPPPLVAAASDLESKFTEAAIGNAQIADYRHFAHGRHHWLAKRGDASGVLALITPSIRQIAERTLKLLPQSVPIAKIEFADDGQLSALSALAAAIIIAGFAGEARGIDPGRPGVPSFGRKIYHLRSKEKGLPEQRLERARILCRKTGEVSEEATLCWGAYLDSFVDRLSRARYRSAVFDYDGTLCDAAERFMGPGPEIVEALITLLKKGIPIGVATGRGKSVKRDLRRILPRSLWHLVVVSYYNGFESGLLNNDNLPSQRPTSPEMKAISDELRDHPFISANANTEERAGQISFTSNGAVALETLWHIVAGIVRDRRFAVVVSSHAVDVIAAGVSKLAVLTALRETFALKESDPILCIGDRGCPPGNDSLLLSRPYSLSVHEVSADPNTCWNLAPRGHRGSQAVLDYMKAFRLKKREFRFAMPILPGGRECVID